MEIVIIQAFKSFPFILLMIHQTLLFSFWWNASNFKGKGEIKQNIHVWQSSDMYLIKNDFSASTHKWITNKFLNFKFYLYAILIFCNFEKLIFNSVCGFTAWNNCTSAHDYRAVVSILKLNFNISIVVPLFLLLRKRERETFKKKQKTHNNNNKNNIII